MGTPAMMAANQDIGAQLEQQNSNTLGLAQFMNDFNRMKHKINVLLGNQKEQDEKITTL